MGGRYEIFKKQKGQPGILAVLFSDFGFGGGMYFLQWNGRFDERRADGGGKQYGDGIRPP